MPEGQILKEPYIPGDSVLHRLDSRVKLPLALLFILSTALIPHGAFPVIPLLFAITLSGAVLSIGVGVMLRRALLALPFVLAALPLLFTLPGEPLAQFRIGATLITLSQAGVERLLSISLKSWLSVQAAILLTATTPLPELLLALRVLRLPRLLVSIIGLMWRYLFLMVEEASRMLRARAARSGASGDASLKLGGSIPWRGKTAGGMAGSLLIRSLERSDRVYAAMLSRGYDGEVRSLPHPPLGKTAWLILAVGAALMAVIVLISFLFGG